MVIDPNQLPQVRQDLEDETIALRFGAFDVLHTGHRDSLAYAATLADVVIVGVMPDAYLIKHKGPDRPIFPENERAAAVAEADSVSYSFVAPGTTLGLARTIRSLRPDVYIEPQEHARRTRPLKAGFLRIVGVHYHIDERHGSDSSGLIIARLGREGAKAHSGFDFHLTDTTHKR